MKEPKIEFPCDYPIKVIGDAHPGFLDEVFEIMRRHDSSLAMDKIKTRSSREGNFDSITVLFWATGEKQLKRVFEDLKECESVRIVL